MANGYDISRLRRMQRIKGWADQKLALEAGVASATVWRLMNGRHKGHPSTVRKIAFALGVAMQDVVGQEGEKP